MGIRKSVGSRGKSKSNLEKGGKEDEEMRQVLLQVRVGSRKLSSGPRLKSSNSGSFLGLQVEAMLEKDIT